MHPGIETSEFQLFRHRLDFYSGMTASALREFRPAYKLQSIAGRQIQAGSRKSKNEVQYEPTLLDASDRLCR
jgi:hypothetical protein